MDMGKGRRKEYRRLRFDSGQHHRIMTAALALGLAAFVPIGFRLYQLMVQEFDY